MRRRLNGCRSQFRKKPRSARLFGCKRPHNGLLSLPPFCDRELIKAFCRSGKFLYVNAQILRQAFFLLAAFFYPIFLTFTVSFFFKKKQLSDNFCSVSSVTYGIEAFAVILSPSSVSVTVNASFLPQGTALK